MRPTDKEQKTTQGMAHKWLEALRQMAPFSGKHFFVISNILVALVFWCLQELMEREFKCPNHSDYNVGYGYLFLFGPFVILTLLTALLTKEWQIYCSTFCSKVKHRHKKWECSNCCSCEVFLHFFTNLFNTVYYGFTWIVVVLLDGDCYHCMNNFGNDTLNKTTEDYGKDDMGSSAEKKPRKLETVSRIIGITLLLGLVIIACLLNLCRYYLKPYYKWQYQQVYAEEVHKIICENLMDNAKKNAKVHYNKLMDKAKSTTDPFTEPDEPEEPQLLSWEEFWKEISSQQITEPRSDKLEPTEETTANQLP